MCFGLGFNVGKLLSNDAGLAVTLPPSPGVSGLTNDNRRPKKTKRSDDGDLSSRKNNKKARFTAEERKRAPAQDTGDSDEEDDDDSDGEEEGESEQDGDDDEDEITDEDPVRIAESKTFSGKLMFTQSVAAQKEWFVWVHYDLLSETQRNAIDEFKSEDASIVCFSGRIVTPLSGASNKEKAKNGPHVIALDLVDDQEKSIHLTDVPIAALSYYFSKQMPKSQLIELWRAVFNEGKKAKAGQTCNTETMVYSDAHFINLYVLLIYYSVFHYFRKHTDIGF